MGKDEKFMGMAISKAEKGIGRKEAPFGACIVKEGKILALEHNVVYSSCDSTAHAEITAIRTACRKAGAINLSGCTIYSTTEPCPMCFSAIHWAKISRIVFGTRIRDAKRIGFSEIPLTNRKLKAVSKNRELKIKGGVMRKENLLLLGKWKEKVGKTY